MKKFKADELVNNAVAIKASLTFLGLLFITNSKVAQANDVLDSVDVTIDCYHDKVSNTGTGDRIALTILKADRRTILLTGTTTGWRDARTTGDTSPACSRGEESGYFLPIETGKRHEAAWLRIKTPGHNAFWIDQLWMVESYSKGPDYDKHFGRNGGMGWCLSTDPRDSFGTRDAGCYECLDFNLESGLVYPCPGIPSVEGVNWSAAASIDFHHNRSKCIHVKSGWEHHNEQTIHLWGECDDDNVNKDWVLVRDPSFTESVGRIRLATNPRKYLSLRDNDWSNGNPAKLSNCSNSTIEWVYDKSTRYIRAKDNRNKCLHKAKGGWENGDIIHLWDCNLGSSENKTWDLVDSQIQVPTP